MKKQQTQPPLDQQIDNLAETLRTQCDQEHNQFLETRVKKLARDLAQAQLPKLQETKQDHYLGEIIGKYEQMRTNVHLKLSGGIQELLMSVKISTANKQIAEQEQKARESKRAYELAKEAYEESYTFIDTAMHFVYELVLGIFMLAEALYFMLIFADLFLDKGLLAICSGLITGFSLVQSVKILAINFRDKKWNEIHPLVKIGFPPFIFLVIIGLGLLRFSVINLVSDGRVEEIHYINNPILYIILSGLPLIATFLIVHRYLLSDKQLQEAEDQVRKEREVQDFKVQAEQCSIKLQELKDGRALAAQMHIKLRHYENTFNERINAYFKQAVAVFQIENVRHRTDGYPQSFENEVPPLSQQKYQEYLSITEETQSS